MYNIIVRSKRDADAIKAMLRIFYRDWGIKVYTLHGARSAEKAIERIEEIASRDQFYIVLLGKEDGKMAISLKEFLRDLRYNVVVHMVSRARVRNMRMEHLAHEFEIARSMLRLTVEWDPAEKAYLHYSSGSQPLEGLEYNPAYDVFLAYGDSWMHLSRILGIEIGKNPILVRKFGGLHDVYNGCWRVAELQIYDEGVKPIGRILSKDKLVDADLSRTIEANRELVRIFENISLSFMKNYADEADTVIVPWSGGKDSTLALILTLKVFPRRRLKVIYVDTGAEFPCTIEYIDKISSLLGIKPIVVRAGVDKGILEEGLPFPSHDNRWCTGRKLDALEKAINEVSEGNTIVVVGDRDAESEARSRRPPMRLEEGKLVLAPIKQWSTLHIQLYMIMNNIPLNPLYIKGFYRIGCYICPALRSWELYIMLNDPEIRNMLEDKRLYKLFLEKRCIKP